MIVFLASGLWHGAQWTFVCWGGLHGLYLIVYLCWTKIKSSESKARRAHGASSILTFVCVCIAWIFFRATNVSDALIILAKIATEPLSFKDLLVIPSSHTTLAIGAAGVVMLVDWIHERGLLPFPRLLRWGIYALATLTILNLGVVQTIPFIYFQF